MINFLNGGTRLSLIAGPCALESYENAVGIAARLKEIAARLNVDYYFKVSIDKANRTSAAHYRGLGFDNGLKVLGMIKNDAGVRVVTDIHEPWQADKTAEIADIIQIPAFLCRQTDLLKAAAETGKIVNVKKAQFMSPEEMGKVAEKILHFGNDRIILCERGNAFGYSNLVVDMTGLVRLKKHGYPVAFDATHSVQISGGGANRTNSGASEYVPYLAKAAIATGAVDVLFIETHDEPEKALCDGSCMLDLSKAEALLGKCVRLFELCREDEDVRSSTDIS
ncbi:MAG: 3-deoxy-8-phosphooctulonate synthase [Synergistaceae bacterium]|jgi:2-dehydro-3-deoxyphosphooctonate aldolase (KDO 8-P synthase)|nr:3-deoxy-8-phosphooctulonate synthase [Synergistaceae bacterium]